MFVRNLTGKKAMLGPALNMTAWERNLRPVASQHISCSHVWLLATVIEKGNLVFFLLKTSQILRKLIEEVLYACM